MKVETINYYDEFTVNTMIADAVKHDRMKRKIRSRRKAQELKQKIAFKILSMLCVVGGIAIAFISPMDGSASVVCVAIGILGLAISFNMEIRM